MKKSDIRKIILRNQPLVKFLMLTERQVNIIILTRDRGKVTSSVVAWFFKISIQNASTQLKRITEKGYLRKTETISKSGGIEYIYEYGI